MSKVPGEFPNRATQDLGSYSKAFDILCVGAELMPILHRTDVVDFTEQPVIDVLTNTGLDPAEIEDILQGATDGLKSMLEALEKL